MIQFFLYAIYEGRIQKTENDLVGVVCYVGLNDAWRDESNPAWIPCVWNIAAPPIGPLTGSDVAAPQTNNMPLMELLRPFPPVPEILQY
jgi:hypothetical protein